MGGLTLLKSPLLLDYDPNILLDEQFSGSNLNESVWTKTDTESKITVSAGALSFSGGKASPAWGDPGIRSNVVYPVASGTTLEWAIDRVSGGELIHGMLQTGTNVDFGIYEDGTDIYFRYNTATNLKLPVSWSAGLMYYRLVYIGPGALLYSSTNRVTWNLIGKVDLLSITICTPGIINYNAAFSSSYVRLYRSSVPVPVVNAVSQTVAPSAGAELLANNGFETFTAGQADSWDKEGLPTLASEASIIHGGTYSQKITNVGGGNQGVNQYKGTTSGQWYLFRVWGYAAASSTISLQFYTNGGADQIISGGTSDQAWSELVASARALGANSAVYARVASDTHVGYVDDASIVLLTLSSLLGANQTGTKEGIWDVQIGGLSAGHVAGMWLNTDGLSDGTQDAIEVIIDRAAGTFRVSKYVAGTLTSNIISSAVTYADNCILRAVRVGNSVAFYYAQNGTSFTQIGTTQTISDQTIISQTGFRAFSTDSAATCTLTARGGVGVA